VTEKVDTRGLLLQQVWTEIRSRHEITVRNYPCATRAIEAGASPDDLVTAMTAASYETAFWLPFLLSVEHVEEGDSEATISWTLAEGELWAGLAPRVGLDYLHEEGQELSAGVPLEAAVCDLASGDFQLDQDELLGPADV